MAALRKRCAQLRDLIDMTHRLAQQIRYTDMPRAALLRGTEISRHSSLPFSERENEFYGDPGGILPDFQPRLCLKEEEFRALQFFFDLLGTTSREDQLRQCERLTESLSASLRQEEHELPQRLRLIATLSLCGGMALILLLM